MKAGSTRELHMQKLGGLGGAELNQLCGRCHRTEQAVIEKNLSRNHTDLFQAHGISQSRCFRESQNKLTCLTCHDPHRNASKDESGYVNACLKCHSSSSSSSRPIPSAKVCPVNSRDKCIGCHMTPIAEPLFPGQPRSIADHYIRVHRQTARRP